MNFSIARQNISPVKAQVFPRKISDLSSCLPNDQAPGSQVPWSQFHFPKPVKTTCGHIAKVQGSGTGSPDSVDPEAKIFKMIEIVIIQNLGPNFSLINFS